jgi:hypothetical protein
LERRAGKETIDFFVDEMHQNRSFAAIILDLMIPCSIVAEPEKYGFTASISKPSVKAELMEILEKHMMKQRSRRGCKRNGYGTLSASKWPLWQKSNAFPGTLGQTVFFLNRRAPAPVL